MIRLAIIAAGAALGACATTPAHGKCTTPGRFPLSLPMIASWCPTPARQGVAAPEHQRMGFGSGKPRQVGTPALAQAQTAAHAPLGVNGHAGSRERVHVAQHGTNRNLQLACQLARGGVSARLQAHQDEKQAA